MRVNKFHNALRKNNKHKCGLTEVQEDGGALQRITEFIYQWNYDEDDQEYC